MALCPPLRLPLGGRTRTPIQMFIFSPLSCPPRPSILLTCAASERPLRLRCLAIAPRVRESRSVHKKLKQRGDENNFNRAKNPLEFRRLVGRLDKTSALQVDLHPPQKTSRNITTKSCALAARPRIWINWRYFFLYDDKRGFAFYWREASVRDAPLFQRLLQLSLCDRDAFWS